MSIEENRAVARQVLEDVVNQGRLELVDQIYAHAFEFDARTIAGQVICSGIQNNGLTARAVRNSSVDLGRRNVLYKGGGLTCSSKR